MKRGRGGYHRRVPRATVPLPLGLRFQQWGAQVLGVLPPRVQLRLSRKPPLQIDGDTLAPDVQLVLAVLDRRREPPLETLSPAEAREARRRLTAVYAGRPVPVRTVADLEIEGSARTAGSARATTRDALVEIAGVTRATFAATPVRSETAQNTS